MAGVLLLLSPVLVPVLLVLAIPVALLVLLVVQAFGEGFAVGCAALAAFIGLPSLAALWLSAVLRLLTGGSRSASTPARPGALPGMAEIEARYRSGDFVHRDFEAEQRAAGR